MTLLREQLVRKALAALSEIADECGERPARKTLSLRFLLMYTFAESGADPKIKWIWDSFWTEATTPKSERSQDAYIRGTGARSALNGICREVGYPPDVVFLGLLRAQRTKGGGQERAGEPIVRYLSNLYEVQNQEKALFDAVEYESEVERRFARDLDNNENVKLFVKLPAWFKIETPIGPYNPDWAFVTEREEKLYFVRETKSTVESDELRTKENQKIACGRRHFDTLGVDYDVVTSLAEVAF